MTNVDKSVDIRFTDKLTVRCDPETKKALKEFSKQSGITSCQIIHALLTAYLWGMREKSQYVDKSPTINLTIERSVLRARRHSVSDIEGYNFYQGKNGLWLHQDGELNSNGHVVGCECLLCRKRGK
jgi:predicted DNA-binding protein